jgi:hypothetical protein
MSRWFCFLVAVGLIVLGALGFFVDTSNWILAAGCFALALVYDAINRAIHRPAKE